MDTVSDAKKTAKGYLMTAQSDAEPKRKPRISSKPMLHTARTQQSKDSEDFMLQTLSSKLSVKTLKNEFDTAKTDILGTIKEIQSMADKAPKGSGKISIDQKALEGLLRQLSNKVDQLGQLGNDWDQACDAITHNLAVSEDKSKTLKKKVEVLTVKHDRVKRRQRSREKQLRETRAIFERSLSDIRSTYEKSHQIINDDCRRLEMMAEEMREHRESQKRKVEGLRNFPTTVQDSGVSRINVSRSFRPTDSKTLDLDFLLDHSELRLP